MTTTRPPTGTNTTAKPDALVRNGMVWVAWRQRRSLILITLGLYAVATATVVVTRAVQVRGLAASGMTDPASCQDPAMTTTVLASCERWLATHDAWSSFDSQFSGVPPAICLLFGLGLGAAVIGHEFEHGISRYSFTQSISPLRWAATQWLLVVIVSGGGVLALEAVVALLSDDRYSSLGTGSTSWWLRPILIVAMICVGFGLSVVSRSSSGGFWGGLGVLMVGGIILNFFTRSTATSSVSEALACPSDDSEICSRFFTVLFRFRALGTGAGDGLAQGSTIALVVAGLAGLMVGFLVLRRRFR